MLIRTRMAPSPTGEYHIGGLRTLLYNYALAKKDGGQFIMRIEDTDQKREVEGAEERLLVVIKDYGLDWDEFYKQSERLDIYKEYAQVLLKNDSAYYCFCTEERLDQVRKEQQAQGLPRTFYDGKCRGLDKDEAFKRVLAGESYVIRQKIPKNEEIVYEDAVLGKITFNTADLDDSILMKSDGFPTYHLAVVIDDHLMNITHILRGIEWLPSVPKHVLLYKAFGWEMPVHAHLPNLKEKGANKKLSKRFGDVHAAAFLEKGYLPEAMLNFLMLLGWNPGTEKEIYTLEEFVKDFSIERIHKTDLVAFDREKLLWFNGYYIRGMSVEDLHKRILEWSKKFNVSLPEGFVSNSGQMVLKLIQERLKTLNEVSGLISYFYEEPSLDMQKLTEFAKDKSAAKEILNSFTELFGPLESWGTKQLDEKAHLLLQEKGYKPKEAFMTLRVAVSGVTATPPIFETLEILGKEKVLTRLKAATYLIDSQ
ncbi:glutamate--tRNA ligase [candidate division WWE3 bacterium RIFCSPHIGHO2_01_FULL_42_13]|uniref:Glutamate--tRNA ligase n=1 Tax=candidate division WWE3 bacterium RIFCSPHIGHO2_01_FULL_42_13 TaxID=1802617 RepID=A0A1F4UQJ9_UNCKA|nr:MAG: glutamate--tRNA ligase [candidate division WWE3 bacterium RIFCSPHIGHO2_01_FULL_42_13]